jgi:hypothetical protein
VGGIFSKIHPFLHFQILQDIRMIISSEQLCLSRLIRRLTALCGHNIIGVTILSWFPAPHCKVAYEKKVIY